MATHFAARRLCGTVSSCRLSTRAYSTGKPFTPVTKTTPKAYPSRPKFPAANASTSTGRPATPSPSAGKADPVVVDDIPPEELSTPPESVPSSSVLASTIAPSPLGSEPDTQPLSDGTPTDWSKSYFGLSTQAFSREVADVLLAPIEPLDVEIKPDGLIYLPEIKYRRVLNKAFGPGGWGLAPRSETHVGPKIVSREYALVCLGRLVAIARGEQEYFDPNGIPTATEACKSNALMRCCKDLGIASELWDPRFIREFKAKHCVEVFAEHLASKKKQEKALETQGPAEV
ncbi:mitochondrial genome maintenance MGM101-domain-containing protein [Fomitopsis serialis]|uniref:mitochondrial genome maintenance MGM101-domain-containing protein n=1 Tax=Fomitopsis serialis TaxID=139415 RepID=UPI0020079A40|nr:mitochondrial genome maintenance MGM101-domain-containing protein [Neoantrodia serialis]KAH9938093.1 mitochondrial genome maintenance MGM101-domain-containing protein [Neoantrodia serialis]